MESVVSEDNQSASIVDSSTFQLENSSISINNDEGSIDEMDLFSVPADGLEMEMEIELGVVVDDGLVASVSKSEETAENLALLKESDTVQRLAALMMKPAMKIESKKKSISMSSTRTLVPRETIEREDYGLDLKKLRSWNTQVATEQMKSEDYRQEYALAKMKGFMVAIIEIVRIQSWWRMLRIKATFKEWREERNAIRRYFFVAWKQYSGSENLRRRILVGKPFSAWVQEMKDRQRLDSLVFKFFQISISRSRLTPQAVMVYFSGETHNISDIDKSKIRRLILTKLFDGWRQDIREMLLGRYRASMILARCMRRSSNQTWAKENLLQCFHMWRRYMAVYLALRRDEPVPRFTLPFIPQWAPLLNKLTMRNLKRRLAAVNADKMLKSKWMKTWKKLMTIDKTLLLSPEEVAIKHYENLFKRRHLRGWYDYLHERGDIVRVRNRAFAAWKAFAPSNRRLKRLERETVAWLDLCDKAKIYRVMTTHCRSIIERRLGTLEKFRLMQKNRKILVCAFALVDRGAHVAFLDCWRRWRKWVSLRNSWRYAQREIRFDYQLLKTSTIFNAWKCLIHPKYKPVEEIDLEEPVLQETQSAIPRRRQFRIASIDEEKGEKEERHLVSLLPNGVPRVLQIFADSDASKHALPIRQEVFRFLCRAQASVGVPDLTTKDVDVSSSSKSSTAVYPLLASVLPVEQPTKDETVAAQQKAVLTKKLEDALDDLRVKEAMEAINAGAEVSSKHIQQCAAYLGDAFVPLLNAMLITNESYIPRRLFRDDIDQTVLGYSSPVGAMMLSMHCERWRRFDLTAREIATLENDPPIYNFAGGRHQHVLIWRAVVVQLCQLRAKVFENAMVELPESRTIDQEVAEVLKAQKVDRLKRIAASISSLLCDVPFTAPPPTEVKIKYSKAMRRLMFPELVSGNDSTASGQTAGKDIFTVLREYTDIIQDLTNNAVSLRRPLLDRDDLLIRNGFLKQARTDFLRLRYDCMSAEERKAIDDKKNKKKKKIRRKKSKRSKGRASNNKKKKNKKSKKISKGNSEENLLEEETGVTSDPEEKSDVGGTDEESGRSRANSDVSGASEGEDDTDYAEDSEGAGASELGSEADLDALDMGIVALKDEIELSKDSQWLSRTASHTNLLFEQWKWEIYNGTGIAPFVDETPEIILERLAARRSDDAKFAMERTIAVMQSFGLPAPPKSAYISEAGVSGWIVQQYFSDEAFRQHFVWQWLPPGWWHSIRIKRVLAKEIARLDNEIAHFTNEVNRISADQLETGDKKSYLAKFLKLARSEIVKIGQKVQENKITSNKDRRAKTAAIKRSAKAIEAARLRVQKEKTFISDCIADLDSGEVVKVLEALEYDGLPKEKGKKLRVPDAAKLSEYTQVAKLMLAEREANLPLLEEAIQRNVVKKADAEASLAALERQSILSLDWMQNFACERFRVMLDVQELLLTTANVFNTYEDKKDEELLLQGHIETYRAIISRLLDEVAKHGSISGESFFVPFDPSDPDYETQMVAYENELKKYEKYDLDDPDNLSPGNWRKSMTFVDMQQRCIEVAKAMLEKKLGLDPRQAKAIDRSTDPEYKIPFVHSHLENTLMNMFGGPLDDPDMIDGMSSARSVSTIESLSGAAISQAMDSHLVGFARPPTELSRANMEKEAEIARQRELEEAQRRAEEKELKLMIHSDYWSNLEKDKEEKVHVDLISVSSAGSAPTTADVPVGGAKRTFLTTSSALARFPNSRTAKMWDRARRSVQGKKHSSNEVTDIVAHPRKKKEKNTEDLDSLGRPRFVAKTRAHMQDGGDVAYRPQFRARASTGFSPAEHPDRPTLMAEIAAAKAKELEDAKSESGQDNNHTVRRKNEMDVASIITDPFIAFGLSEAKYRKHKIDYGMVDMDAIAEAFEYDQRQLNIVPVEEEDMTASLFTSQESEGIAAIAEEVDIGDDVSDTKPENEFVTSHEFAAQIGDGQRFFDKLQYFHRKGSTFSPEDPEGIARMRAMERADDEDYLSRRNSVTLNEESARAEVRSEVMQQLHVMVVDVNGKPEIAAALYSGINDEDNEEKEEVVEHPIDNLDYVKHEDPVSEQLTKSAGVVKDKELIVPSSYVPSDIIRPTYLGVTLDTKIIDEKKSTKMPSKDMQSFARTSFTDDLQEDPVQPQTPVLSLPMTPTEHQLVRLPQPVTSVSLSPEKEKMKRVVHLPLSTSNLEVNKATAPIYSFPLQSSVPIAEETSPVEPSPDVLNALALAIDVFIQRHDARRTLSRTGTLTRSSSRLLQPRAELRSIGPPKGKLVKNVNHRAIFEQGTWKLSPITPVVDLKMSGVGVSNSSDLVGAQQRSRQTSPVTSRRASFIDDDFADGDWGMYGRQNLLASLGLVDSFDPGQYTLDDSDDDLSTARQVLRGPLSNSYQTSNSLLDFVAAEIKRLDKQSQSHVVATKGTEVSVVSQGTVVAPLSTKSELHQYKDGAATDKQSDYAKAAKNFERLFVESSTSEYQSPPKKNRAEISSVLRRTSLLRRDRYLSSDGFGGSNDMQGAVVVGMGSMGVDAGPLTAEPPGSRLVKRTVSAVAASDQAVNTAGVAVMGAGFDFAGPRRSHSPQSALANLSQHRLPTELRHSAAADKAKVLSHKRDKEVQELDETSRRILAYETLMCDEDLALAKAYRAILGLDAPAEKSIEEVSPDRPALDRRIEAIASSIEEFTDDVDEPEVEAYFEDLHANRVKSAEPPESKGVIELSQSIEMQFLSKSYSAVEIGMDKELRSMFKQPATLQARNTVSVTTTQPRGTAGNLNVSSSLPSLPKVTFFGAAENDPTTASETNRKAHNKRRGAPKFFFGSVYHRGDKIVDSDANSYGNAVERRLSTVLETKPIRVLGLKHQRQQQEERSLTLTSSSQLTLDYQYGTSPRAPSLKSRISSKSKSRSQSRELSDDEGNIINTENTLSLFIPSVVSSLADGEASSRQQPKNELV